MTPALALGLAACLAWAVLLDGLSIQVALKDPIVDPERAFDIAMDFAEQALGLPQKARHKA